MQLTRYKLGDLIVQRREKNKNFDVPIRGVSKEGFIKPKQQEADTSIYNVFYRNDFVFNPARMELNSIALNLEFEKALCSSLYEVFYVKDESVVLPEYLNLHIKRDEFARYCDYIGLGSAREYCRFANIAGYEIDLPSIDKQHEIVEADRLIKRRISLNEQMIQHLEATAQALYRKMFVDNIDKENLPAGWRTGTLGEVCETQYGYTETATTEVVGPKFLRITDIVNDNIDWSKVPYCPISNSDFKKYKLGLGDIVVSRTGANIGWAKQIKGPIPDSVFASFLIRIKAKDAMLQWLIGHLIESSDFKAFVSANQQGSAQPQANANVLVKYPLLIPNKECLQQYNMQILPINENICLLEYENSKLTELQSLLLAKMGQ